MKIADSNTIEGSRYPAGRLTQGMVGNNKPILAEHFCMGLVTLDPKGGQVPWHHHMNEEVYFIIEGNGQICVGKECREICTGQMVYIPPSEYHQLTNTGDSPLRMMYCYAPAGDVEHWKLELAGTLPKAGVDAPPLPDGAWPQCTDRPE